MNVSPTCWKLSLANTASCDLADAHSCPCGFSLAVISFDAFFCLSSFLSLFLLSLLIFILLKLFCCLEIFVLDIKLFPGKTGYTSWRLKKRKVPFVYVLIFQGCHNSYHKLCDLTEIYSCKVLMSRCLKANFQQGFTPSAESPLAYFSVLWWLAVPGILWPVAASLQSLPPLKHHLHPCTPLCLRVQVSLLFLL